MGKALTSAAVLPNDVALVEPFLAYHAGVRVLDENSLPEQRNKVFNVHVGMLRHDVLHQAVEHFRPTLHIGVRVCGQLAVLRRAEWGDELEEC